jgi:hypothetical protein
VTAELPPEAKPTDPNGLLVDHPDFLSYTTSGSSLAPPPGYEWSGDVRLVREVRPIPEPTVMVELTVKTALVLAATNTGEAGDACRAALEREGLT